MAKDKLNKKYNFDIEVIADTYAGELALPYVAAAVKSPDTVAKGYVRQIDGLNKSAVIGNVGSPSPVVASACGFSDGSKTTFDEQVLTLTQYKVNEEVCRGTVFPTWIGQNMQRNGDMPQNFSDFLMSTVAANAGQQIENGIWKGILDGTNNSVGFLSNDGAFDAAGLAASACADFGEQTITTMTNINTSAQFALVYDKAVATIPGILSKPDVAFYCSMKTYGLYIQQLAGAATFGNHQGVNNLGTNQQFASATFLGIPILVCPGMFDDAIVLTYTSNMVYGSNLATDSTEAQIIPTYNYMGNDAVRIIMNFALGVQTGVKVDGIVGATFV
tara:strand:- start:1639 stop:2631 length:993 start_codon:yes stop_codon:yes gene_type:complete